MTLTTRNFELHPWQTEAVDRWVAGIDDQPFRGTLEIVTGGGKTLIALACAARVAETVPDLRLAVVVPTQALARQWRDSILRYTSLTSADIGLLGAGGKSALQDHRVVIAVLNTASRKLPAMARTAQPLMLIIDECHRAGAPRYRDVLSAPAQYRLGLSATPDREELGDDGEPLAYDEQAVGQSLGGVVYRFSLKSAREAGWLPEFTLNHHGVSLAPQERVEYEALSRRVDDAADTLRSHGVEPSRARSLANRRDERGDAARQWVALTTQRKDLLYRAKERTRVAELLVEQLFAGGATPRVILFHERVEEAVVLHEALASALPGIRVELEHSKLPARRREAALAAFANGDAPVLVSVKSLIEGIDVPQADTGVSVASTSSVRQRVQALGRVLRRSVTDDGESKSSTMHIIYVADTVDDLIYAKADWTDLTGADANRYWRWEHGADAPISVKEPPRTPLPTEEQAWDVIGCAVPEEPIPWPGVVVGQEYVVKTSGAVFNAFGAQIANTQGVDRMVARVRGRPGGRFRVTPEFGIVLVWQPKVDDPMFYVAGQLTQPFQVVRQAELEDATSELAGLVPGDDYLGPSDKTGGAFKITQRAGGLIERRVRGGAEVAEMDGAERSGRRENARRIVAAWEDLDRSFSRFFVNSLEHAWYEGPRGRKFLGVVRGGFSWPDGPGED